MLEARLAAWGDPWEALDALVEADGTAGHAHAASLRRPRSDRRDLADAVHALLALHGALPGLAGEAARTATGLSADWLEEAAAGLARERHALAALAAAAGPLPSTPGQAATDGAWTAQRHAFSMLARSDRLGVAVGAAAALVTDWVAVRRIMARAADAFGLELARPALPDPRETATVLRIAAEGPAAERAVLFGARALVDQHRAMWALLEARASARNG